MNLFAPVALLLAPAADPTPPAYPFAVAVVGTGRPMVFVPGLACSGRVWDGIVDRFKGRYECHVLTPAGFAGVPPVQTDKPYLDTLAAGVLLYARDKKLDRPVVVGHSLGAMVALQVAATGGRAVGAVVAVDGFPCPGALFLPDAPAGTAKALGAAERDRLTAATRAEFLKAQEEMFGQWLAGDKLAEVMRWVAASDQRTVAGAKGEVFAADLRPGLAQATAPVLVVGGYHKGLAEFKLTDEEFARRIEGQMAGVEGAKVAVHPDSRHFVMHDRPDWLAERMGEFLTGK